MLLLLSLMLLMLVLLLVLVLLLQLLQLTALLALTQRCWPAASDIAAAAVADLIVAAAAGDSGSLQLKS